MACRTWWGWPTAPSWRIECKRITAVGDEIIGGTDYNYLDVSEDLPATDTIRAYYTGSASTTDRINYITGQIRHVNTSPVICVDTGPGYDPQVMEGQTQLVSQGTIAWAKTFQDGAQLSAGLAGKVVSGSFSDLGGFYMQEPGRSSGICVNADLDTWPEPGQLVTVNAGQLTTINNQRVISALAADVDFGDMSQAQPLGMGNKSVAGTAFNVLTPGATDATAQAAGGLNTVGLLVKTWGRVTNVESDHLVVTDGSDSAGVWVDLTQGSGDPIVSGLQVGDMATVTGIASLQASGDVLVRAIKPRNASDLSSMYHDTTPPVPGTATSPGCVAAGPVEVDYSGSVRHRHGLGQSGALV